MLISIFGALSLYDVYHKVYGNLNLKIPQHLGQAKSKFPVEVKLKNPMFLTEHLKAGVTQIIRSVEMHQKHTDPTRMRLKILSEILEMSDDLQDSFETDGDALRLRAGSARQFFHAKTIPPAEPSTTTSTIDNSDSPAAVSHPAGSGERPHVVARRANSEPPSVIPKVQKAHQEPIKKAPKSVDLSRVARSRRPKESKKGKMLVKCNWKS